MAERRPGGRPWGPLRARYPEAAELAMFLRRIVHESGMSINDIANRLTPDHFANRSVPRKSTISARLSGEIVPDRDFVEAIVDVCVSNKILAERRREEGRRLWLAASRARIESAKLTSSHRPDRTGDEKVASAYEMLVKAQRELIEVQRVRADSDRLLTILLAMNASLSRQIEEMRRELAEAKQSLTPDVTENVSAGDALLAIANTLRQAGQIDESIDAHRQAVSAFQAEENPRGAATAMLKLGLALTEAGRVDEALQVQRESFHILQSV